MTITATGPQTAALQVQYDDAAVTEAMREMTSPAEVAAVIRDALAESYSLATERGQAARADPFGLTISALGGCTRQAAYRLAGTAPSDPDLALAGQNRSANHGTWLDEGLVPLLAEATGGRAQVPTRILAGEDVIPGRADLVFGGVVVDLKSVRESRLTRVIGSGAYPDNRVQALGYAVGLHQQGVEVNWVCHLYLDRSTGAEHPVVERFTQQTVMVVLRRVWQIQGWAARPDHAPRTERGPGHSWACDSCPWLKRCWGKDARPGAEGPQRLLARDRDQIARVLLDYQRLGAQAGQLKRERDFLRAIFTHGSRPGDYGDLRWHRTAAGHKPDAEAMEQILQALGIEVPMTGRAGQVRVGPARPPRPARPRKSTGKSTGKGRGRKAS